MRITPKLVPPVVRTTPWVGFAPAGVVAITMAWVASRQPPDTMARLLPTRLGVLAIVIGIAFVFDDPAAVLSDPAPSPLIVRRLIRSTSAIAAAGALVLTVLVVASAGMDLVRVIAPEGTPVEVQGEPLDDPNNQELPPFPGGRIVLEAATMIAFTLAISAAISHRGDPKPGRITTSVLLGAYAISWMIPDTHKPWANPGDRRWETVGPWWWAALGLFALAAIVLSWDTRISSVRRSLPYPLRT